MTSNRYAATGHPRRHALAGAFMLIIAPAAAQAGDGTEATPFELGSVTVLGQRSATGEVRSEQVGTVVSREEMQLYSRDNIGDALNLLPGVTMSNNVRNEKTITVRGYDARQVPLFIDGIPVYVPYDGYVDFNRFATADLAAIQVAKGFSSIAYGPNTLGGAINLISRKPRAALEGDASLGVGSGREQRGAANLGSNQGLWYIQTGVSYLADDGMPMSSSYLPTASEDGGLRNNDRRRDSKVSLKLGLTPVAGDEYALSFYRQDGEKGQPPSTEPSVARYWKWPYWDKQSLYFVSSTALGQFERLKVRLYHDRYANEVDTYTDASYTTLKSSGSASVTTGRSIYNDRTNGGSIELQSQRIGANSLQVVAHYKHDEHVETDGQNSTTALFSDTLFSLGIEDNIELADKLKLTLGAARNELRPDTVYSSGNAYSLPGTKGGNDAQAGLFYDPSSGTRIYATVARKTRLPTLKDRYSQRLGTYIENPGLKPEKASNYEIGYQAWPSADAKLEAAFFVSDISDKIQSVANVAGTKSQMQNIGQVRMQGIELSASGKFGTRLELGSNYTYTQLDNVSDPTTKVTDIPQYKATAHALLHAGGGIDTLAFIEYNSARWASNTLQLHGFTTLNLKAIYKASRALSFDLGVNNVTDRSYALADGFPSAGRSWSLNANYQF